MKPTIIILSLVGVALAVILFVRLDSAHNAAVQRQQLEERVSAYSNQVEEARTKLVDQERVAAYLQSNLTQNASELVVVSNAMTASSNALSQAENRVRESQAENQKLSTRLTQVEGERDGLQTRLNQLAQQINSLNDQISETSRKLAAAEGDRDFLTKELARLQSDKAELVRQFNDVAAVRAQLALLREEAAINQRLAWMNQGIYQRSGLKGAQAMVARPVVNPDTGRPSLDVELQRTTKPAQETPTPEVR